MLIKIFYCLLGISIIRDFFVKGYKGRLGVYFLISIFITVKGTMFVCMELLKGNYNLIIALIGNIIAIGVILSGFNKIDDKVVILIEKIKKIISRTCANKEKN